MSDVTAFGECNLIPPAELTPEEFARELPTAAPMDGNGGCTWPCCKSAFNHPITAKGRLL